MLPASLPTGLFLMETTKAYESKRVTLWHGRAEEVLPSFSTKSFDLVIADPPYGQEWRSNQRSKPFAQLQGDGADSESRLNVSAVLAECLRVVGKDRHLYVFGPVSPLLGLKVSAPAELIWHKLGPLGGGNLRSSWAKRHEPIQFVVSKFHHAGKTGRDVNPTRLRRGSVLRFGLARTGLAVRHPTEKPVALLTELIESSSRQGEIVLDPFAGVGSTGVAAVLTGRRCVLVESDSQWIPIAIERLKEAERIATRMAAL